MHNKKLFYVLILIIQTNSPFSLSSFDKLFQQMQDNINELHNSIEQMRQEEKKIIQESTNNSLGKSSISIDDSQSDNAIVITVNGVDGTHINAHITYDDQERPVDMTIETDSNDVIQINYQTEYRYLTIVSTHQKQNKMEQEKSGKSKKERIAFSQVIQHGTTLHSDIDLENASVELNETTKVVTITIPKIVSKKQIKKDIPTSVVQ